MRERAGGAKFIFMSWRLALLAGVALGVAAPTPGGAPGAPGAAKEPPAASASRPVDGTYRMQATVRLAPGALPAQDVEARGDAVLEPGSGPGLVRARLAARGQRCVLEAKLAPGGDLTFAPGQRCRVVLDDADAKGTVDATLGSGGGRARDGLLTLDLAFRIEGAVALRSGSLELLGAAFGRPGLAAEVPVSGEARARAEGRRDESRAAGR